MRATLMPVRTRRGARAHAAALLLLAGAALSGFDRLHASEPVRPALHASARDEPERFRRAVARLREETRSPALPVAMAWLRQSAASGRADAQYLLGTMLDVGQHTRQDTVAATRWLERAARRGHPEAMLATALQYFLGRGVPQDDARAAHWYLRAADTGDAAAQYMIASMHETGLGVPRDLDTALLWYGEAARQGDTAARIKAREIVERLARERGSGS